MVAAKQPSTLPEEKESAQRLKLVVSALFVATTISVVPIWWTLGESLQCQSTSQVIKTVMHATAVSVLYMLFFLWYWNYGREWKPDLL